MDASDPCIPWYFPINDTTKSRLCDPWEARIFTKHMDSVPLGNCDGCLPDCSSTMYSATVSSAPFRRCDYKNFGVSFLCKFEEGFIEPPIWGQKVRDQYIFEDHPIPENIGNSNIREFADVKASGKEIFIATNTEKPAYDAYEKDIAIVNFIFETDTVFEYRRDERMTFVQYISQMGGLLGLWLGFSFISAIEMIYWCTMRLAQNM